MLYLTLVLSTKHNIFGDFFFRIDEILKLEKVQNVFKIQPKKEIKDITKRKTTTTLQSLRNRTPATRGGQQNACVTNVTGLLFACFVVIFTKYQCFLVFYNKICLKEDEI